ncbi:MAG: alcohol dehydrogenase catalytic domain-containing protein [Ilumatobacteraceae bacterium]
MRQIFYTRPGLTLDDVPEPTLRSPSDVKIAVAAASLCGSDLHMLRGDFDDLFGNARRVPLGHEASGTVVEVGPAATAKGLQPGDAVTFYFNRYCGACRACRSGREQFCSAVRATTSFMSDVVVLDEQQVFALPRGLTLQEAAVVEPVSVAMRGVDLCPIHPGTTVAVSGGGGIGQLAASLARLSGAVELTLIDPVAAKRDLAAARGAAHVVDPTAGDVVEQAMVITDGDGFDVVIETSGAPVACAAAMETATRGGTVELLATYAPGSTLEIPLGRAFLREITLVTGVYQAPYVFPRSLAIAPSLGLGELVTPFAPEQYAEGFAAQRDGDTVKTVFDFAGTEAR